MSNLPLEVEAEQQEIAPRLPTKPVSAFFIFSMCVGTFVTFMGLIPLTQSVIPKHVQMIFAGSPQNFIVGRAAILQALGGLCALIVYPLMGAFSDRTRSRFGRRRPWIVGGTLLGAVMLLVLANIHSYELLLVAWVIFCIGAVTAQSSFFILLPDKIPVKQRAIVAAFVGLTTPLGIAAGTILAGKMASANAFSLTYYILAAIQVLGVLFFATQLHEELPEYEIPRFNFVRFLAGFWLNPRTYPDFARAWLARLLIVVGFVVLQDNLFFFLQATHLFSSKEATNGVAIFQSFSALGILLGSFGTGYLSDRLQLRKPFAILAGALMALALLSMAAFPSLVMVYVVAVLFGISFGSYSAAEVAMGSQLLRSTGSHGKDMGLLAVAGNLPQMLGPLLVGAIIAWTGNYSLLFFIAALFPIISMACIPFIKSVR